MKIKKYVTLAIFQLCLIVAITFADQPGDPKALCCGWGCTTQMENGICQAQCSWCNCGVVNPDGSITWGIPETENCNKS